MSDFLELLGVELVAAEQRLVSEPREAPAPVVSFKPPRFRRRGTLFALAALLISVPALAATRPWEPLLGDARHGRPVGVSPTPPPAPQLRALSVLRRAQNPADQAAATRLLAAVGGEYKGVRTASLRLLKAPGGQQALLVPTEAHGRTAAGGFEAAERLCVVTGTHEFCGDTEALTAGDLVGGFDANFLGLVPDGVASIRVAVPGRRPVTAQVRDNFFWISGLTLGGPVTPRIAWLDEAGRRVGPPR